MAKLSIPDQYQAGVAAIRSLSDGTVASIRTFLDGGQKQNVGELAPQGSPKDVAVKAVVSAQVDINKINMISEALAALYRVKEGREESVEEFAENVCDSLETLSDDILKLPHEERPQFKAKLVTLLGAEVFGLATKFRTLRYEHERTFCTGRIVTDIRPIFGSNVEEGPRAMCVTHMLRLAYHEGSETTKDFYIAMDADDLRELRKLIDRAEIKARTLRGAVKDARLLVLGKE